MDRFKPRTSGSLPAPRVRGLTAGLAACGVAGAVALSGCGAGQVSQMATQEAAVNGSPDVNDKLVSITSDVGTVSLSGDTSVPANGVLAVGEPDGQIAPLESAERADAAKAKLALSKPITNGLTYQFTFAFEKAGETTVAVPISAGEAPRREAAAEGGDTGGHH